ncbi:hypothetical protein BegalDRAFT_3467 [Beggiatoa alba B18LD]|uniref:Uncharacterized protein n=1 Tax=Beggiatoa alba B18LD TaxID=395493 RepID=I3CKY8_9GAMM|nr:hypothetical protein BegalDRAFT_3467 [Beggiatoa alba B18LD]
MQTQNTRYSHENYDVFYKDEDNAHSQNYAVKNSAGDS